MTVKFNAVGEDYPIFISVILHLIDLDEAQILIQKKPLDKNGDLIFDIDEIQQLNNNAVQKLSRAIGVDDLTTFADVGAESMSDTNAESSMERNYQNKSS